MADTATHTKASRLTGQSRATKAVLASGAAVVLLAGAGGTFSLWFDSADVGEGSITSGELALDVVADSETWQDTSPDLAEPEPIAAIEDFRMVPGDELEYSATVSPTLVGDNLEADLTAEIDDASGDLAEFADISASVDGAGTSATLTEADNETEVPVTVTVSLPESTGGQPDSGNGTDGQNTTLDLSSLVLSLVQTDRS